MTLGGSQLVDSFANGWPVTAADLHALGGPDFTVSLRWTPQREVWAALGISGLTLLLCLVLVLLPARWRRRVRAVVMARLPERWRSGAGVPSPEAVSADDAPPSLTLPFLVPEGAGRTGVVRAVLTGLLTGAVAAAVTSVGVGLVVAALVALGLQLPWARVTATAGGVAFVVAGCLAVITGQAAHHYLPGSNWAGSFVHAGNLIWVGLALLLADAVIGAFSGAPGPPGPEPPTNDEPSPAT